MKNLMMILALVMGVAPMSAGLVSVGVVGVMKFLSAGAIATACCFGADWAWPKNQKPSVQEDGFLWEINFKTANSDKVRTIWIKMLEKNVLKVSQTIKSVGVCKISTRTDEQGTGIHATATLGERTVCVYFDKMCMIDGSSPDGSVYGDVEFAARATATVAKGRPERTWTNYLGWAGLSATFGAAAVGFGAYSIKILLKDS